MNHKIVITIFMAQFYCITHILTQILTQILTHVLHYSFVGYKAKVVYFKHLSKAFLMKSTSHIDYGDTQTTSEFLNKEFKRFKSFFNFYGGCLGSEA